MTSSINIALSGLNAATTRLEVSANNLANQFSTSTDNNSQVSNTPYVPQQVDQVSLSSGGVLALVSNVSPATTTVPDPQNNGTTQMPNVDPANEMVQQITASIAYKTNLKSIQTQNSMFQSLLDIIS